MFDAVFNVEFLVVLVIGDYCVILTIIIIAVIKYGLHKHTIVDLMILRRHHWMWTFSIDCLKAHKSKNPYRFVEIKLNLFILNCFMYFTFYFIVYVHWFGCGISLLTHFHHYVLEVVLKIQSLKVISYYLCIIKKLGFLPDK